MDITRYQGTAQFGAAYETMPRNDTHAPGSVDRVLFDRMVQLCDETAGFLYSEFTPDIVGYRPGGRPAIERLLSQLAVDPKRPKHIISKIFEFCAQTAYRHEVGLDELHFGGTEEEIIAQGSDWCTDIARVACVMCQVAGVPARLVMLFNVSEAYSSHQIIEAHVNGELGAADPVNRMIYLDEQGELISTWRLMKDRSLADECWTQAGYASVGPNQFLAAAICNYGVADAEDYDYSVSRINDYYRSILAMSDAGWPGGLRWLHGEDESSGRSDLESD